jgi:hypothetical protein
VQAVGINQIDVRSSVPPSSCSVSYISCRVWEAEDLTATTWLLQVEGGAKADLPLWLSETLHKHNLATVHRPNFLGEKCAAHSCLVPGIRHDTTNTRFTA